MTLSYSSGLKHDYYIKMCYVWRYINSIEMVLQNKYYKVYMMACFYFDINVFNVSTFNTIIINIIDIQIDALSGQYPCGLCGYVLRILSFFWSVFGSFKQGSDGLAGLCATLMSCFCNTLVYKHGKCVVLLNYYNEIYQVLHVLFTCITWMFCNVIF